MRYIKFIWSDNSRKKKFFFIKAYSVSCKEEFAKFIWMIGAGSIGLRSNKVIVEYETIGKYQFTSLTVCA